jgi:hypothetical protein
MQNNIYKINLIFRATLGLLVLSLFGLSLFLYNVDPVTTYIAIYQLFFIVGLVGFLAILAGILFTRIKILKNISFLQQVYKHIRNSLVLGFAATFWAALVYTSSLTLISGSVVVLCLFAYCAFEFLD